MKLIGMLDSPYVRRVAICLDTLGIAFEHEAVSVFSTFGRFQAINPVVKAPTLVCDDGGILMDSTLILQYVESGLPGPSLLWSNDPTLRLLQFRSLGYAMAATEKCAQLAYETGLRPAAAQFEPWKQRVRGQMRAAFDALEQLTVTRPAVEEIGLSHATIGSAIAWQFAQSQVPAELPAADFPHLVDLSSAFEELPVFRRYPPDGPGVPGLPTN